MNKKEYNKNYWAETKEKRKEQHKKWWANKTKEEKEEHNKRVRERLANETLEQREKRLIKRKYKRDNRTSEQKENKKIKDKILYNKRDKSIRNKLEKEKKANRTPEQKELDRIKNKKRKDKYKEKYKEKILEQQREYGRTHRETLRVSQRIRARKKRAEHPIFRITENIRRSLNLALKTRIKFISVTNNIGCARDELIKYIESQFQPGMTWENHGNGKNKWNIDHIKPLCSFDLSKKEEQLKACYYTNLRPLWFEENNRKAIEDKKLAFKYNNS